MQQFRDSQAPSARDPAVELVEGDINCGIIVLCDHASAAIPEDYSELGLPTREFERHIAYDIGAREVALDLARQIGSPAVLSRFSRLLIDPNRGTDDPTLVMRIADGAVVPGNAAADADEITRRIERFHAPYHDAVDTVIDNAMMAGVPPALLSVHSFTPRFKGIVRPWHATVLWDSDPRLPVPLVQALEREVGIITGENVPYTGRLKGDTLYRHGTMRGLAHALVEIRQDLIDDPKGWTEWSGRLARIMTELAGLPNLNEIRHYGSGSS